MFIFRSIIHLVLFIVLLCTGYCELNVGMAQEANIIISGQVIYPNGQPIAAVTITELISKSYSKTDAEGKFTLPNISSGHIELHIPSNSIYIRSVKIGKVTYFYQSSSVSEAVLFTIVPGTIINDVEVIAEKQMQIQGRIVFKNGKPLKNTFLNIKMDTITLIDQTNLSSQRSIVTNADGYFQYHPYTRSIVALTIHYRGLSAATEPFLIQSNRQPVTPVLKLNGNPEDFTLPPPVLSKNKPDLFMYVSNAPGMWVINPMNGHAYKWIKCSDRIDAQIQAEKENAYLVTITSEAEQRWIETVFAARGFYWIGITDEKKEGEWIWENGEIVNYTNWAEPRKDKLELISATPPFLKTFGFKNARDKREDEIQDYAMMTFSVDRNGKWKKTDAKGEISTGSIQLAIIEKEIK